MSRRGWRFQNRVVLTALAATAPAWLAAAALLWRWNDAAPALRWTVLAAITLVLLGGLAAIRRQVMRPLQSLANMLEALREGDYSMRGRNVEPEDAVGEVMIEVNSLSQTLYSQRLEALEAGYLLQKVIADVDIAVFAFDANGRLRLVNDAGAVLLRGTRTAPTQRVGSGGRSNTSGHADDHRENEALRSRHDDMRGKSAVDLGLDAMLAQPSGSIVSHVFPGGAGRWEIRRRTFREGGKPHELLVITELSRALREEERQAWQRLVRVIGHELNGSLAPIKSMAGTLRKLIDREPPPADWRDDAHAGLTIIHDRAAALSRFMGAYAQLARLPPPARRDTAFAPLVRRVAALHDDHVTTEDSLDVSLAADPDQLEQVLINLIRNAVEAAGEDGHVRVRWRAGDGRLLAEIEDDGPGLARTDNLWVPFFTTKPGGNGIGLVLSREIVENHGGTIALENRADARGCVARISLPLAE